MAQPATRPRASRALATAVALLAVGGCGPGPGSEIGDGRLVAREAVYPGPAGPLIGGIAHSDDEAAGLWDTVGLPDDPPPLDGEALVVVSGGEPDDCRWRLDDVTVESEAVRLTLNDRHGLFGHRHCDGEWEPRTLAVTVPAVELPDDASVRVDQVDGLTDRAAPVTARPDPALWDHRELTADHFDIVRGCHDGPMDASAPGDWLQLMVVWRNATSRTYDGGGFDAKVALPDDRVGVSLRTGSHLYSEACSDMVSSGRPLVADRWSAVAGRVSIRTWIPDDGWPLATVTLRDITLEPRDGTGGDPWRIDELRLDEVPIGGVAG